MRACRLPIDRQPSEADPVTHYVIVRADLPHGMQVAQTVHAAGESTPARVPRLSIAVALHATDESQLRYVADRLTAAEVPHHVVVETDGPHAGQAMSIGVEPTRDRARVRKVVSGLPLVR